MEEKHEGDKHARVDMNTVSIALVTIVAVSTIVAR
jgi:hypothetical protein